MRKPAYLLVLLIYVSVLLAQEADLVMPIGHTAPINCVLLNDDNSLAYTISEDKSISIWQLNTTQEIRKLRGGETPLTCAAISSNGRYAAAGGSDGKCLLWNTQNGKILKVLPHNFNDITAISFHSAGRLISVATFSNETKNAQIKIWETAGGTLLEEYSLENEQVIQFAADIKSNSLLAVLKSGNIARLQHGNITIDSTWNNPNGFILQTPYDGEIVALTQGHKVEFIKRENKQKAGVYQTPQGLFITAVDFGSSMGAAYILLSNNSIITYNPATATVIAQNQAPKGNYNYIKVSSDGRLAFLYGSDNNVLVYDLSKQISPVLLSGKTIPVNNWCYGKNQIAGIYADSTLRSWRIKDRILLETLSKLRSMDYSAVGFLGENEILLPEKRQLNIYNTSSRTYSFEPYNFISGKPASEPGVIYLNADSTLTMKKVSGQMSTFGKLNSNDIRIVRPYRNGLFTLEKSSIYQYREGQNDGKWLLMSTEPIVDFDVNENGDLLAIASGNDASIYLKDTFAHKISAGNITGRNKGITHLRISPSGTLVALACTDNLIRLFDAKSGKILQNYYGHSDSITRLQFSDDENYLYSSSADHTLKCWAVKADISKAYRMSYLVGDNFSYSSLVLTKYDTTMWSYNPDGPTLLDNATLMATGPEDWIAFTPERYYYCNKEAARELGYNKNGKFYPFDQFDLKYNRPDIVLRSIGINDSNLIHAFEKAYAKRLSNAGLTASTLADDFSLPDIRISNMDSLPSRTKENQLKLELKIKDQRYPIKRLLVYVNGVNLTGKNGIDLSAQNSRNINYSLTIPLAVGENLIQASVLNNQGTESIKATHRVIYETNRITKPNLYLIAISVSEYDDKSMNLQYAVKDGRDIVKAFSGQKRFEKIHVDTLFNKTAKADKLPALKKKLQLTKVDDEVILFVSGHGLLDDSFNFYFASSNVDFKNPALHGISFDALESLLDSIPARKKLMLIDACHSGELDPEEKLTQDTTKQPAVGVHGIAARGTRLLEEDSKVGLQNSFELMQELFSGLNKGSGTTVISAAAGKGYAYESKKWNNGVFTYALLSGMMEGAADIDGNKQVSTFELLKYVSKEVDHLTKGAQKPTSRRENNLLNWVVWEIK